jgi:acetyltransferase-like isoleucine patch superfamily enzyme
MKFFFKILNKFIYMIFIAILRRRDNIKIGKNVKFYRLPVLNIHPDSTLIIRNNVTINSENSGYHLNMYAKCKILIDRPKAKIEIGENTRIHGSCLHAFQEISIGRNCLIAANCQIIDGNGHDLSFDNVENRINTKGTSKAIFIEDNVWIGTNVVVLPGVRIGNGSIISANSVVHKDIPPMVIAGGNPIEIIKKFEN